MYSSFTLCRNIYNCPTYTTFMHIIDTHVHLYSQKFDSDRHEAITRAKEAGVQQFLLPNIDINSLDGMRKLVTDFPNVCFPMIGLHPCHVEPNFEEVLTALKPLVKQDKAIAVGEIGIDLYWDKTTLDRQTVAFKEQIDWAKEYQLPIVIHCRDAFDETLSILEEVADENLTGVLHCFTGTRKHAERLLALPNFYIGLGGVLTFKNGGLDKIAKDLPLDRLILETDAPYLAPAPHRGKRNEPAYTRLVAQKLADIKEQPINEIAQQTTHNAQKLFGIKP